MNSVISHISSARPVQAALASAGTFAIGEASLYLTVLVSPTTTLLSVCQKCEQAIGFIVSQDGEVKAVKAARGKLFFWDGILD